jgi:DNA-binding NarL/FixJ family response regulator
VVDAHQKTSAIRVLLVDDHAMVRQGLRCALEVYPNIEVVGEASNGDQAIECVAKVQPTVVVMDIVMPKMDGIAATRLIRTQYPHIAVVGLTRDLKKKSAVVQLYDAIQRALGIDGKGVDLPEMGPGLGSMTEAT